MAAETAAAAAGWQAELALRFAPVAGRTALAWRRHRGPLHIQRPFYPEADGTCHAYILHPPGGVVGGDSLTIQVGVEAGAQTLVTTPAAGKFYRSAGPLARQQQQLIVAAGASLEWLPQENILYRGAEVRAVTRVELAPGARFLGWELLCFGLPAAREPFDRGHCRQGFEIWRDGRPLILERAHYAAGSPFMDAAWGLRGRTVTGSFLCVADQPGLDKAVREAIPDVEGEALFGVTQLDGVLVCRYLGKHAEQGKALFVQAWDVVRNKLFGKAACPPRIWKT